MTQNSRATDNCARTRATSQLLPAPRVHADLAATIALAVADQRRSTAFVEI
jgi:hypothetical protein